MKIDLNGHHALVCGGSKGIGAAIAIELAQAGAKVTIVSRNGKAMDDTLARLSGKGHEKLAADFSDPNDVDAVIKYINSNQPGILINNTGGPAPGQISDASVDQLQQALQMHLFTAHRLVQACLDYMKDQRFGRIVNIISTSVKIPIEGLGVSNTTRGAMASWAKTLSNEVAPFGVTVNNILPGLTNTDRLNSLIEKLANDDGITIAEQADKMMRSIPARRFGNPQELACLAVFLCSEMASYITGTSIPVDGGKTGSL